MHRTILILSAVCGIVRSSGVAHLDPLAPVPVVTAASSQYFERTFNRLIVAPPVLEPVIPVAPPLPVFVEPAVKTVVPIAPVTPTRNVPVEPNVAIAVATAHAAAPVATILLPPYPFGPPSAVGFVPSVPTVKVPIEEPRREPTTRPTLQVNVKTTTRESEPTTPLPSNSDNTFVQALPSNQNVHHFKEYYAPPIGQLPLEPLQKPRPQKLKTSVEIVPVPLTYIAPPPIRQQSLKTIKHVHTFIPSKAKIIIRPVSAPLKIRTIGIPARLIAYRVAPLSAKIVAPRYPQSSALRTPVKPKNSRDIEPTTFRPFTRPNTKPPRL